MSTDLARILENLSSFKEVSHAHEDKEGRYYSLSYVPCTHASASHADSPHGPYKLSVESIMLHGAIHKGSGLLPPSQAYPHSET